LFEFGFECVEFGLPLGKDLIRGAGGDPQVFML